MATTRQRRAGAAPETFAIDDENDQLLTEEDYAAPELPDEWEPGQGSYTAAGWTEEEALPDEAFQPDDEDGEWAAAPQDEFAPYPEEAEYPPQFEEDIDFSDDLDPLSDELLTDEERAELQRSRWQLISGLADFVGVILGTAAILVLLTLLVSLLNWLINDISQSFILLQKNL